MIEEFKNADNSCEISKILNGRIKWDNISTGETFGETADRYAAIGRNSEAKILRDAEIRWWQIEEPGIYDDNGNIIE